MDMLLEHVKALGAGLMVLVIGAVVGSALLFLITYYPLALLAALALVFCWGFGWLLRG